MDSKINSNLVVSLIPTNFEALVKDYVKQWDDHINWVRQTLSQIKLDADNASLKTPQTKIKSTVKKKRSTTRGSESVSRPSASIINSVMADKSARITRSTSRFLKQYNMINDDGNLIKLNKNEVLKVIDENAIKLKKNKETNEQKKVSFDSANLDDNKKDNEKDDNKEICENKEIDKPIDNKQDDDESVNKENKDNNIKNNDKNLDKKFDNNKNENSESFDKQVKISTDEKSKEIVNKKIEELQQQDQEMECSPIKAKTPQMNTLINSNLITPNNKTLPQQIDEDEWITDDESISIKKKSIRLSTKSNNKNDKIKEKGSNLLPPSARAGLKRSATLKSATKPPLLETKRNKTNEFATPQSLKKLYRPFQYGSASKKITRIPTVITKSAITTNKITSNFGSKLTKPDNDHHLDTASQSNHLNNQHQTTNNRFLIPPSSSASSSICSNSQGSLKSGLTNLQQTTGKTLARNNSTNSSENKKAVCFGESALKQRLKEEERRKLLESKIEKENEAKAKKEKLLKEKSLQTKSKREERERRIKEVKLLHDTDEQKRIVDQKKLEEVKKQVENKLKAEEAAKKLAELKRIEDERRKEEEAREELKRKKEEEELRLKREEELRLKREEEFKKEQQRLRELKLKEKQATVTKKVQIKIDNDDEDNEDLQTKLFNKIEKEIKKDEMKCKNTPLKQLVVNAVGKTNAEKSLLRPEIDPSLEAINLSFNTNDSRSSNDEEETQDITTNNTFIKGINNKETLSSTFIKPVKYANNLNQTVTVNQQQKQQQQQKEQILEEEESLVLDSYDISDLRSEDEEEEEQQTIFKRIPDWAKGNNFLRSVKEQFDCGIRARENKIKGIFSSIESNVSLQDVFNETNNFVSKKYERRTSSACWSSPPATYIDSSFSKFY